MTKPKKKPKKAGNLRARFVDEFMIDRNATEAAIRAGYSKASAGSIGSRLLKDVKILTEINKRSAEQTQRLQITADRIMQEYERLALLDPLDLFRPDGSMKNLAEMPEDARRAIVGIEIRELKDGAAMLDEGGGVRALETTLKKIKLADKKGALDSLAKILGMMKDRVEHSGRVTLEDLIVGKNEATS
jgi:phage terminase small subunit